MKEQTINKCERQPVAVLQNSNIPDSNQWRSRYLRLGDDAARIQALYQVPRVDKANPSNALGIYEEDFGYIYAQQNLDRFFASFTPYVRWGTHPALASIGGGITPPPVTNTTNPFIDNGETELDLQTAYPQIFPKKIKTFQVGDPVQSFTGALNFNDFLDAIDG